MPCPHSDSSPWTRVAIATAANLRCSLLLRRLFRAHLRASLASGDSLCLSACEVIQAAAFLFGLVILLAHVGERFGVKSEARS